MNKKRIFMISRSIILRWKNLSGLNYKKERIIVIILVDVIIRDYVWFSIVRERVRSL